MVGEGVEVMGMVMVIAMIGKQRIYFPRCSLYRVGRSIGGQEERANIDGNINVNSNVCVNYMLMVMLMLRLMLMLLAM